MEIANHQKAEILARALPYIQMYRKKVIVVKYGGNAMINEELKNRYNGFDLKDYGYSRVSGFLRSIKGLSVDGNVVRIKK